MLEGGFRGGSKIGIARADADDQVGLTRAEVGAGRAGYADRAEVLPMVERQRSLARLGLADRNTGLFGEARQGLSGIAINDTAAGDNKRSLTGANPLSGAFKQDALGKRTRDMPDALVKELRRIIPCLGLERPAAGRE